MKCYSPHLKIKRVNIQQAQLLVVSVIVFNSTFNNIYYSPKRCRHCFFLLTLFQVFPDNRIIS